ncbi:MAG: phage/plasmid primase, P4 family, partial [archaeon]
SFVVIKDHGEWREWLLNPKLNEINTIPHWLRFVDSEAQFKDMKDGDGRNNTLFSYIITLQKNRFTKKETIETIEIINEHILKNPLDEKELSTILRDDAFIDDEEVKLMHCLDDKGRIIHHKFGDELIKRYNIVTVNDRTYIYEDGYYQQDPKLIERAMIEIFPSIKSHMRNEVLSYIKIKTHKNYQGVPDPYVLNVKNGRLNVMDKKLTNHSPNYIEFERLPVAYKPDAYDKVVDKTLDKVFCYDEDSRLLFEELLGYCLLKNTRYQKGFMLYGGGSNGKSTILNMIREFIGRPNIATIELDKIHQKFLTAELENKLVNIGDDINQTTLRDTGTIKKLFSGEGVLVQRKNERPFTLYNYATMIFTANHLPHSLDKSKGFYRRFEFIPFEAEFDPSDEDFDPRIEEKLTSENAKSYLLNLALEGLERLTKQDRFTQPQRVEDAKTMYKRMNSSVLTWVDEEMLELTDVKGRVIKELYLEYKDFSKVSGVRNPVTRKTFTREMKEAFNVDNVPKRIGKKVQRVFE